MLVVLDLDETLIHATPQPLGRPAAFESLGYHVYRRPFLDEFLKYCQAHARVGVWTSAGAAFAADVVRELFDGTYPLEFVWSRQRCTRVFDRDTSEVYFIKNLSKLKRHGFTLEQMLMVDDTPQKLERHYGNLIRMVPWFGDEEDVELLRLMAYLDDLLPVESVRSIEKRGWQQQYEVGR